MFFMGMWYFDAPRYPYGHEELAVCEDVDQVYL